MPFEKGVSGNPAGRPKGALSKTSELRRQIESNAAEIIRAVIDKAIGGDMTACKILLDRIIPVLKSTDIKVIRDEDERDNTPVNDGISEEVEESIRRILLGVDSEIPKNDAYNR